MALLSRIVILLILIIPIPPLAVTVLGPQTASRRVDLSDMTSAGELRVVFVEGSPYFVSLTPGADPGLEIEILEGFARLHHLRLRLVQVASWQDLLPALLEGRGDLIAGGVTNTASRRTQINFTTEVFPTRDVVVTRKPTSVITTLEQLRAVKVGTIKQTSLADRVAEARVPRANVDDMVPATGFAEALRSHRVAALVDGVEDALLLQKADPDVQLGLFLGPPQSLAFGVRKDSPVLLQALNEYVTNLRRTPSWNRFVVKYFGDAAIAILTKARTP